MKKILFHLLMLTVLPASAMAQQVPTANERIPKLRQTTVVWDGEVKPSRAVDARALLQELPALPTAAQIAEPSLAAREVYYNKLVSINLRVEEIDAQEVGDEDIAMMRNKLYGELSGKLGLTVEEMKMLEDSNLPDSERERIENKMQEALLGGKNLDEMAAGIDEKRLEKIEKCLEELEKKEEKGTLTAAEQQEVMKLQQELMSLSQQMMQGLSGVMELQNTTESITNRSSQIESRLKEFSDKMVALRKSESSTIKSCKEIAQEYEMDLESLYEEIAKEEDAGKVEALYAKAGALMKNYRTRAAKVFLSGLQTRLDNTKALLPECEEIYAEMAENGLIPQSIAGRMSLNIVTQCTDILNEAYTDFPQPEVLPVSQKVVFKLKENEYLLRTESWFGGTYDNFINGSQLLLGRESDGEVEYYELVNGQRRKLSSTTSYDFAKGKTKTLTAQYGEWSSQSGKRKVFFDKDGSLTLHDGTIFYPLALKRSGDKVEFIIFNDNNEFVACTYKL